MYSIMYSTMYSNNNLGTNVLYTDVDVSVIVRIVNVVVSVDVSVEDKRWPTTVSRTPRVLYGWVGLGRPPLCQSNISYLYIFTVMREIKKTVWVINSLYCVHLFNPLNLSELARSRACSGSPVTPQGRR